MQPRSRPILFSDAMVSAILDGRKLQTRRVLNPQPWWSPNWGKAKGMSGAWLYGSPRAQGVADTGDLWSVVFDDDARTKACTQEAYGWGAGSGCPYGTPGDRLWLRESHYRFGHWEPIPTKRTRTGRQKWAFVADPDRAPLYTPPAEGFRKGRHHKDSATPAWHKRLGRFMPRTLSRLTLEITEVRVQRLQEISEEDARAEGAGVVNGHPERGALIGAGPSHREGFAQLWQSINGERQGCSWESSPWVWCITFRVVPR